MRTRAAVLLLLAGIAAALEPADVYARAAPATVVVDGAVTAAGFVVDRGRGLILTIERAVHGRTTVRVVTRDGATVDARVVAGDNRLDVALVEADLAASGAKALELAAPWTAKTKIAGMRVYAIGHGAGAAKRWKFHQGEASRLEAVSGRLSGLRLLRHDASGRGEGGGGPLLDTDGRVAGLALGEWKSNEPAPPATTHALPVNAIRAFLSAERVEGFKELPPGSLAVFGKTKPEAPAPPEGEPPPDGGGPPPVAGEGEPVPPAVPPGLRYGPYVHYLASREQAALKRRATKVVQGLRGLYYRCPRCKGEGVIRVLVREGYTEADGTVVPAVYAPRTCPRCDGARKLFRESVAAAVFERYAAPGGAGRDAFLAQARRSGSSFLSQPPIRAEVEGTHGVVVGPRAEAMFPLHFELLPDRRKYEWFLSEKRSGKIPTPPAEPVVAEVAAADILLLDNGMIVRVCGLVVPDADGKAPPPDATTPNEEARLAARARLLGKRVRLTRDKYSPMTCDGHPLVFVEVDGEDCGESMLEAGLVRRHTRHKHARHVRYMHAETEAKKAHRGIWAE